MANEILMSLLSPEQRSQAQEDAFRQGLLGLSQGLIRAAIPQGGRRTSTLEALALAAPGAVQSYRGSFDQTLKDLLTNMQVKDMMAKREREANLQKAIQGAITPSLTMPDYQRAQSNIDPMALESGMSDVDVARQATPTGPATIDRNRALAALAQYGGMEGLGTYLTATKTPELPGMVGEFAAARSAGLIPASTTLEQFAAMKKPPGVTVNTGEKASPFEKKAQEAQATVFSDIQKSGIEAQRSSRDVQRLGNILDKVGTGGAAAFKQAAGNLGIKTEGLDEIQAAQAIINKLVPQQRPPGSGTMSDADLALYKESLPRIINQPGANKRIVESMKQINQYLVKEGEIASAVLDGEISPAEGRRRLRDLGNPVQDFFEKNPTASPGSPVAPMNSGDQNLINKYLKGNR
jgi:hypothetical protein